MSRPHAAAILALATALSLPGPALSGQEAGDAAAPLTAAVREIHDALEAAYEEFPRRSPAEREAAGIPRLTSAVVRLAATAPGEGEPAGPRLILGREAEPGAGRAHEVVVTLRPRRAGGAASEPAPVSDGLVRAVVRAHAAARASVEATSSLEIPTFQVRLGLVARRAADGRVAFEVVSHRAGAGERGSGGAAVHTLRLVFES